MKQLHDQKYLDNIYQTPDPWGFKQNPDDYKRKSIILERLEPYGRFQKALDIGAGEGWITQDLPADLIYGFDISEVAMSRFPVNVYPLHANEIDGKFDLIIATGIIYPQYDYEWVIQTIQRCACHVVLCCHITVQEHPAITRLGDPVLMEEFDYLNVHQQRERLRIYDFSSNLS